MYALNVDIQKRRRLSRPEKWEKPSTNKTATEDNNAVTATSFASKINASFKDALTSWTVGQCVNGILYANF